MQGIGERITGSKEHIIGLFDKGVAQDYVCLKTDKEVTKEDFPKYLADNKEKIAKFQNMLKQAQHESLCYWNRIPKPYMDTIYQVIKNCRRSTTIHLSNCIIDQIPTIDTIFVGTIKSVSMIYLHSTQSSVHGVDRNRLD